MTNAHGSEPFDKLEIFGQLWFLELLIPGAPVGAGEAWRVVAPVSSPEARSGVFLLGHIGLLVVASRFVAKGERTLNGAPLAYSGVKRVRFRTFVDVFQSL
jgi:hypothetical protein